MVDQISAQQAYINSVMKKLPQPLKGQAYTIQKGDNLWKVAKRSLNKKNVTNKEVNEQVLLIAKLNELTTLQKMNNLKASDTIYLPKAGETGEKSSVSKPKQVQNSPAVSKPKSVQKTGAVQKTQVAQKAQTAAKALNSSEKSILKLQDTILKDKTVTVEKMYKGYQSSVELYHVYNNYTNPKTGYRSTKHPLLSYEQDSKTGKILSIQYNDQISDKNPIRYDYYLDSQGNILDNDVFKTKKVGKMDNVNLGKLHSTLKNMSKNCKAVY